MSNIAIKVENLSKLYRLGQVGTGTLRHDFQRWWSQMRGKEDPFAKIGQVNDRTKKAQSGYVWALKGLDFEVRKGEVLGIIGANGAGKSTLLKILSKITSPTSGYAKVYGRVASLLEVGTGFHPEMTGRENIFLNGAILGMRRWEIQKKFDEIVDFAGVEAYIDTPVKRYSSGMYVRLAFAVAAYLEPEILIVDEVLAVGDAEFQKKCLGRMKDVSVNEGRTVLFVSHNLIAVKSLCSTGILLDNGKIKAVEKIEDVIHSYLSTTKSKINSFIEIRKESNGFIIHSANISNNGINGHFNINDDLIFEIIVSSTRDYETININLFFKTMDDAVIFASCTKKEKFVKGEYIYKCIIPANTLNDITYKIDLMVVENGPKILHALNDILSIEGEEEKRDGMWMGKFPGFIRPLYYKWTKSKLNEVV